MRELQLGVCEVPDGTKGPWAIETFEVSEQDAMFFNLRARGHGHISPGSYKRLKRGRTVVMSNTPMEIRTNREAARAATGRVLINGLGLGVLLRAILKKPDVTYVRVIEVSQDVIDLVAPHFNDPRLEIVCADAMEYRPPKGERFNYVWHDIWNDICSDNLEQMATLARRYGRRTDQQGFWAKDICLEQRRRWR